MKRPTHKSQNENLLINSRLVKSSSTPYGSFAFFGNLILAHLFPLQNKKGEKPRGVGTYVEAQINLFKRVAPVGYRICGAINDI